MSDDGDYMDDSEEEDYDDGSEDGDDAVFEAPAVQAQESSHASLTPEECDAAAKAQVQSVVELLCWTHDRSCCWPTKAAKPRLIRERPQHAGSPACSR